MSDTKKELLMRIVVVALAFTLTVSGIVYLTKALLGDTEGRTVVQNTPTNSTIPVAQTDPMTETPPVAPVPAPAVSTPAPAAQAPTPVPVTPAPAPTTQTPAAAPVATTPPPAAPTPVASATPQTVQPPIHVTGTYVIQFSSFRSEESAKTEARRFIETCADMYVTKVELANGIWYRVRGCNTDTRQAAETVKAEIKSRYNIDSLVVNVQ